MRAFLGRNAVVIVGIALALYAADKANFSGTWQLNLEKSRWGSKPKPLGVTLVIDHKDPSLEYRGTVRETTEDSREFHFQGAIDGKQYPMMASGTAGQGVLRWVNTSTLESEFHSADGKRSETTRTSLSSDGKTLTRSITEKTPEAGTKTWTEVYDRH